MFNHQNMNNFQYSSSQQQQQQQPLNMSASPLLDCLLKDLIDENLRYKIINKDPAPIYFMTLGNRGKSSSSSSSSVTAYEQLALQKRKQDEKKEGGGEKETQQQQQKFSESELQQISKAQEILHQENWTNTLFFFSSHETTSSVSISYARTWHFLTSDGAPPEVEKKALSDFVSTFPNILEHLNSLRPQRSSAVVVCGKAVSRVAFSLHRHAPESVDWCSALLDLIVFMSHNVTDSDSSWWCASLLRNTSCTRANKDSFARPELEGVFIRLAQHAFSFKSASRIAGALNNICLEETCCDILFTPALSQAALECVKRLLTMFDELEDKLHAGSEAEKEATTKLQVAFRSRKESAAAGLSGEKGDLMECCEGLKFYVSTIYSASMGKKTRLPVITPEWASAIRAMQRFVEHVEENYSSVDVMQIQRLADHLMRDLYGLDN